MFDKLLYELRQGGVIDIGKLAAQLDTSAEMVRAMLEHLQRAGILHAYEPCGGGCEGCSLRHGCHPQKRNASQQLYYLPLTDSKADYKINTS